jgi:hypothetical protein
VAGMGLAGGVCRGIFAAGCCRGARVALAEQSMYA